jgi:nucleoside diphosphate kinase
MTQKQLKLGNYGAYVHSSDFTGLNEFEVYKQLFLDVINTGEETLEDVALNLFNAISQEGSLFVANATKRQLAVILKTGFKFDESGDSSERIVQVRRPTVIYDFSLGYVKPDAVSRSLDTTIIDEIGSEIDIIAIKRQELDQQVFNVLYFESQPFAHYPNLKDELVGSEVPFFLVRGPDAVNRLNETVQKLREKYGLDILRNSVHSANQNRVIPEVYTVFKELYREVVLK